MLNAASAYVSTLEPLPETSTHSEQGAQLVSAALVALRQAHYENKRRQRTKERRKTRRQRAAASRRLGESNDEAEPSDSAACSSFSAGLQPRDQAVIPQPSGAGAAGHPCSRSAGSAEDNEKSELAHVKSVLEKLKTRILKRPSQPKARAVRRLEPLDESPERSDAEAIEHPRKQEQHPLPERRQLAMPYSGLPAPKATFMSVRAPTNFSFSCSSQAALAPLRGLRD